MEKKTLYLIHHSHTDIGYTDRQEKISRYHVAYICRVIEFLKKIDRGEAPQWEDYTYVCENYWQVEQFLAKADSEEKKAFEEYVERGLIDISLTYLNLTELVDNDMLDKKFSAAQTYTSRFERKFDSAMTADINGFSWGYADLMYKNGIRNFYSCLHTHHGMFPLFKKQQPFWWETQTGNKLLVWNGDHYQIGNDFMFAPNSDQSKQYVKEGFTEKEWENQLLVTKERVFAFFKGLEEEEYPLDFCPAMISGIVTDNSPPSPRMMEGINRFNKHYGNEIKVELVTLNHFFEILRNKNLEIPTYKGDWPDWWADGVSSTPAGVKIYREAQRKYRLVNKLDPKGTLGDRRKLEEAEENLLLYAEHTWGFHSSVSEPWDSYVNLLDTRKSAYAINGHRFISDHLDDILEKFGEEPNQLDRESYFKIINPHDQPVTGITHVFVQHWQTIDDSYFYTALNDFVDVINCASGETLVSQVSNSSRGKKVSFCIALDANETRIIRLKRKSKPVRLDKKYANHAHIGAERVEDIASYSGYDHDISRYGVKTTYFDIKIDPKKGITSIIDRSTDAELIHPEAEYPPFSGIYEVTPFDDSNPYSVRSKMGRNRKAPSTNRSASTLIDSVLSEDGPLYSIVTFTYKMAGTGMYKVDLTVYKNVQQIDASIRIQKTCEWAPENVYIALPFTYETPDETTVYFEKSGSVFRPFIDQLPGTNTSFYMLDNGVLMKNKKKNLFIAVKDTPLVTMGSLESGLIELCQANSMKKNKEVLYSWAMNNFWETNFKVDLSGFYELDYSLYLYENDSVDISRSTEVARHRIEGLVSIPYTPSSVEKEMFRKQENND